MFDDPEDFLFDGAETFQQKTEDYGESWRTIGHMIWMMAGEEPITLESPEDIIAFGLYTRRFDKFARALHGEFVADDMNFESVLDSHVDEMTYAAMHASNQSRRPAETVPKEPEMGSGHPGRPVDMMEETDG